MTVNKQISHLLLREYADGNINSVCNSGKGRECIKYSDMMMDLFFTIIASRSKGRSCTLPVKFDRSVYFMIKITEISGEDEDYQKCKNCGGIFTIHNPDTSEKFDENQEKIQEIQSKMATYLMNIIKENNYPKESALFKLLSENFIHACFNWLVRSIFAFIRSMKNLGTSGPTATDWGYLCKLYSIVLAGLNAQLIAEQNAQLKDVTKNKFKDRKFTSDAVRNRLEGKSLSEKDKNLYREVFKWFEEEICSKINNSNGDVDLDPEKMEKDLLNITENEFAFGFC